VRNLVVPCFGRAENRPNRPFFLGDFSYQVTGRNQVDESGVNRIKIPQALFVLFLRFALAHSFDAFLSDGESPAENLAQLKRTSNRTIVGRETRNRLALVERLQRLRRS